MDIIESGQEGWYFINPGLKMILIGNAGQLIAFFMFFFYIISPAIPPLVFLGLTALVLVVDVAGHAFLGMGLLKYRKNRKIAKKAGAAFIIWSLFALSWRVLFIAGYLLVPHVNEQLRYLIFNMCKWLFIWNSMILAFGIVHVVWSMEAGLAVIAHGIVNFIGSFILGSYIFDSMALILSNPVTMENFNSLILGNAKVLDLIWPEGTFFDISGIFYSECIKFIVTPLLGIIAFRDLLKQSKPASHREMMSFNKEKDLRKAKTPYWDNNNKTKTSVIPRKEIDREIIMCQYCNREYPAGTIHTVCLECGNPIQDDKA